ncbi:MAG TPA: dimethylamine corrinoid protein 3, partial [Methanosarcina sp.]|nr:dimethylamine corrinoid protein 3 [Methanosarcina sp.]
MSKEELLQELAGAMISCKKDAVLAAVEKAKGELEPSEIIEKGLAEGMNEVGVRF